MYSCLLSERTGGWITEVKVFKSHRSQHPLHVSSCRAYLHDNRSIVKEEGIVVCCLERTRVDGLLRSTA